MIHHAAITHISLSSSIRAGAGLNKPPFICRSEGRSIQLLLGGGRLIPSLWNPPGIPVSVELHHQSDSHRLLHHLHWFLPRARLLHLHFRLQTFILPLHEHPSSHHCPGGRGGRHLHPLPGLAAAAEQGDQQEAGRAGGPGEPGVQHPPTRHPLHARHLTDNHRGFLQLVRLQHHRNKMLQVHNIMVWGKMYRDRNCKEQICLNIFRL